MNPSCLCSLLCVGMALFPVVGSTAERDGVRSGTHDKKNLLFEPEQTQAVEAFLFTTAEISYRVHNVGTKAIRILDVEPRHGTGGGRAEPAVLQPGAEGKLTLSRQVIDLGLKWVAFRIHTDDVSDPDYSLKARLFGISAYAPDIPGIDFEVVRAGRVADRRITISSYEAPQLDMKAVLESPSWLEIKAVPRVAGESTQELVIEGRLLANAPQGLLRGSIHLLTTVQAQPDLVIPVQARVFDSVSVSPMPATMKPAHVGETRNVILEYRSLDGKALTLESVKDSTGALLLKPVPCGVGCARVSAEFKTRRVGEFGGTISARFALRNVPVDVGWDILVVKENTKLIDLGVIGDEAIDTANDTGSEPGEQP